MRRIRIGIIGCGSIAKSHVEAYKQLGVSITALADINQQAAEAMGADLPEAVCFTDYKALIDSGLVDAVGVCTPPVTHEETVCYAVKKNVHVLLEKPQAHSVDSAKRIVAAAEASAAQLMMAFRHRYVPAVVELKKLIQSGAIGVPVMFHNSFYGPAFGLEGTWFTQKAVAGGGSMLDTGSHSVDLFRYLMGEIESQTAQVSKHFEKSDVEDTAVLVVKSVKGVIGAFTSCFVAGASRAFIEVTGQGGVLTYDYFKPEEIAYKKRGEDVQTLPVASGNGFLAQVTEFIRAIESGSPVPITARDGLRSLEVISQNYEEN